MKKIFYSFIIMLLSFFVPERLPGGDDPYHRKLIEFCWSGNIDSVKALPVKESKLNERDVEGLTALHVASFKGYLDIVKYLVEQNVDVNVQTRTKLTPLHLAAQQGHKEIVEYLLDKEAEGEAKTVLGQTPMHLAMQEGQSNVVALLMELQKQKKMESVLEKQDENNNTLLHVAVVKNDVDMVKQLLASGSGKPNAGNRFGNTPLHLAAAYGYLPIMEELLNAKANINATSRGRSAPLHYALSNGNTGAAKLLIERGADVDVKDDNKKTPLHFAAELGNAELFDLLIQKKPKVLTNNGTILHSAVSSGSVDLVKKCIEAKLDVNAKDDDELTPLFIAAMADSKEIVGMLLAAGARVDAEDQSGKTALHYAAINGNKEMISMLLAAGAEVNAKTERDITPLHYAALCASPEIVNLLLEHKAEVNTKTTYKTSLFSLVMKTLAQGLGTRFGIFKLFQSNMAVVDAQVDRAQEVDLTPLHFAASNGSPGVVQLLVERNAAIEAPSSMKSTPLHVALRANRDTIALYLLSRKANVNAQDDNKNTPLHIAARNQDILMIQALLENGADISLIDKEDSTVFDILFARENYGGIKLLCENLKANTSLMKRFIETETPVLQYAALAGDVALVKMLVDSKAKINDRHYMTSLQFAMVGGSASIVDLLLASGADPGEKTSNGNTSVHIAAATGNSSFIQLMLSKISDGINKTNDNGQTPLMLAICSRNVDAVKQLVASGADVKAKDKQRMNALHYAAAVGSLDMVKYFVEEQKLDVKSEASEAVTPLHVAASMDKPEIVEYLLLNGAKLDAKTSEGFTALHYAAQNGNFDLVKSFEAKGAKHLDAQFIVWRKTLYGAAQYAKEWGSLGLVGMLVYSARDNRSHNWKPIHLAARNGHNDIVQFLRQTGEMVTAKTDDKLTPLHLASMNGNIEAMKTILSDFSSGLGPGEQLSVSELDTFYSYYGKKAKFIVTSGCNVNSQDANGWTPLHWAYLFEREEAVDLLKKMGADIDRLTTSEVKITENIFIKQDLPPQYLHGVLGYILEIVRNPHINTVGPTRMELWR